MFLKIIEPLFKFVAPKISRKMPAKFPAKFPYKKTRKITDTDELLQERKQNKIHPELEKNSQGSISIAMLC